MFLFTGCSKKDSYCIVDFTMDSLSVIFLFTKNSTIAFFKLILTLVKTTEAHCCYTVYVDRSNVLFSIYETPCRLNSISIIIATCRGLFTGLTTCRDCRSCRRHRSTNNDVYAILDFFFNNGTPSNDFFFLLHFE